MSALDEIIGRVKDNDRCLYERAMVELYEMRSGFHFDEPHARDAVGKMHHGDHRGEHWDFLQVSEAITPHLHMMSDSDTMWDAYVALNMWWHDLSRNYTKRNAPDDCLIEDAMTWAFDDEDAPDGKVWRYIRAMS